MSNMQGIQPEVKDQKPAFIEGLSLLQLLQVYQAAAGERVVSPQITPAAQPELVFTQEVATEPVEVTGDPLSLIRATIAREAMGDNHGTPEQPADSRENAITIQGGFNPLSIFKPVPGTMAANVFDNRQAKKAA